MEVLQIIPCEVADQCLNSIEHAGLMGGKCGICRLSPEPQGERNWWRPKVAGAKHPGIVQAKKQAKLDRFKALQEKKKTVNRGKQKVLTMAARAEKITERNLIRSTKNSGRSHKDGDHIAGNEITLDTKLQSKRDNPVVLLHELLKVGDDARRAGTMMGALVLRNRNGIGVVAMTEADFGRLLQRIS